MKPDTRRRFSFIGKSMLWSLLLYVTMMLTLNWDEVSMAFKGRNSAAVVAVSAGEPADIDQRQVSGHDGIRNAAIIVLRVLGGIASQR